jgi:hypothetical protein
MSRADQNKGGALKRPSPPRRATTDNLWSAACRVMDDALDPVRAGEIPGNVNRASARVAIKEAPAAMRVRCAPDDLDYLIFLAGEIADLEMQRHQRARDCLIKARNAKNMPRFRRRFRAWVRGL